MGNQSRVSEYKNNFAIVEMKGAIESIVEGATGNDGANAEMEGFNFTTTRRDACINIHENKHVRKRYCEDLHL